MEVPVRICFGSVREYLGDARATRVGAVQRSLPLAVFVAVQFLSSDVRV